MTTQTIQSNGKRTHQAPKRTATPTRPADSGDLEKRLATVLQQVWGFDRFRPLQLDAMRAVLSDQDSVVVFPTGGGKSLCFQAPALVRSGLGVVVSPLISLMKDQVDALRACGVKAAFLNSSMSAQAERGVIDQIKKGELQLLYLAPERLLTDRTEQLLESANVSFFAIDEAHCVSQWGHDFRPEYRSLSVLKRRFPGVALHAYTATATPQVRNDIIKQLNLNAPAVLIGSMDRPNLNYQLRHRTRGLDQIVSVLDRHTTESGIIYCISRKQVESTSAALNGMGYSTLPYHAGMTPEQRKKNQEAFLTEQTRVIVATIAFGMGIDKSNVRFVIHASMPKSLEAYQQESGRAGRDGLDAECWMFFSERDAMTWKRIIDDGESGVGRTAALQALEAIRRFCNSPQCRHVALAHHFGEQLATEDCGACDVCLEQLELVDDPLILAQKILSCVYRVEQRFGAGYVSQVLVGSRNQRILTNGHDQLSTFGLLATENQSSVRTWIEQLINQQYLARTGEYQVLTLTDRGNQVLRGDGKPKLTRPPRATPAPQGRARKGGSWEGVDPALFKTLQALRSEEARTRNVPADVIFSDTSLRDMARRRPSTEAAFRLIIGVGKQKMADYGPSFLAAINQHCRANGLSQDIQPPAPSPDRSPPSASAAAAFPLFDQQLSVPEIARRMQRAESTVYSYLSDYIRFKQITDPTRWVPPETSARIEQAIQQVGIGPLKPIFVALDETVAYPDIRIVMTCMSNRQQENQEPSSAKHGS